MNMTRILQLKANWTERLEPVFAQIKDISRNPPILIYQMGKVGSTTVHKTLQAAHLGRPIYHVHFLTAEGIKTAESYYVNQRMPGHLRLSKALYNKIARNLYDIPWKIITMVRDPIGRQISDLFQNITILEPGLMHGGKINASAVPETVNNRLAEFDESTDYVATWFDRELKSVFDVDVYRYPFDHGRGYSIIHKNNVSILVIRMEGMNDFLSAALGDFLDSDSSFGIVNSNVGQTKDYAIVYKNLLKNFSVPRDVCERIYSSKYAMHFYSQDMRNDFIQRWSAE